jgi:hypothetical protein
MTTTSALQPDDAEPPEPSPGARALAQQLHNEMRADIPNKKFPIVGSLLPPPWSQKRIDRIANLVDQAIDARIQAALDTRTKSGRAA